MLLYSEKHLADTKLQALGRPRASGEPHTPQEPPFTLGRGCDATGSLPLLSFDFPMGTTSLARSARYSRG